MDKLIFLTQVAGVGRHQKVKESVNGFCYASDQFGHRRVECDYRRSSGYRDCPGCRNRVSRFQEVRQRLNPLAKRSRVGGFIPRPLIALFSAFFFLFSVVWPGLSLAITLETLKVGPARFIAPGGAAGLVLTAATALGRVNPWVAGISLAVQVASLVMENATGGGQVAFSTAAASPQSVTGWINGTPPASTPAQMARRYGVNGTANKPSMWMACKMNQPNATSVEDLGGGSWRCNTTTTSYMGGYADSMGCWDGYTYTPATQLCTLNVGQGGLVPYPSNGVPTLNQSGNGWVGDIRDPDNDTSGDVTGAITREGPDAFGNPTKEVLTPQSTGGYKFEQWVQTTNAQQTYTTYQTTTVNTAGNVTNFNSNVTYGTISQVAAPPVAAPQSSSSGSITLPTDYMRDATGAAIQAVIQSIKDDSLAADAASGGAAPPDIPSDVWTVDALHLPEQSSFLIPAPPIADRLPGSSSSCVPLVVALPYLGSMSFDPCPIVLVVRPLIDWGLVTLGVFAGISIILSRPEGEG